MAPFKKSGGFARGADRPQFARKSFGRPDRGVDERPRMFTATCSECRKACEVPFRPTGDRAVFCRDCFGGKRGSSEHGRPSAPAGTPHAPATDTRLDDLRRQVEEMNKKLDILLALVEAQPAQRAAKVGK